MVSCEENPQFLGVYLNRCLDKQYDLDMVCGRAWRRMVAIRKLSAASWMPTIVHMYTFYMALVDSVLFFAAEAWMPLLRPMQMRQLDE